MAPWYASPASPKSLFEINAASAHVRLAWHIGNRHTDLQVIGSTLRIRRDGVLGDMLRGLLDANDLLRAVDMLDLQPHHLPGAQSAAISEAEQDLDFEAAGDGQWPARLVGAHHLRKSSRARGCDRSRQQGRAAAASRETETALRS